MYPQSIPRRQVDEGEINVSTKHGRRQPRLRRAPLDSTSYSERSSRQVLRIRRFISRPRALRLTLVPRGLVDGWRSRVALVFSCHIYMLCTTNKLSTDLATTLGRSRLSCLYPHIAYTGCLCFLNQYKACVISISIRMHTDPKV